MFKALKVLLLDLRKIYGPIDTRGQYYHSFKDGPISLSEPSDPDNYDVKTS